MWTLPKLAINIRSGSLQSPQLLSPVSRDSSEEVSQTLIPLPPPGKTGANFQIKYQASYWNDFWGQGLISSAEQQSPHAVDASISERFWKQLLDFLWSNESPFSSQHKDSKSTPAPRTWGLSFCPPVFRGRNWIATSFWHGKRLSYTQATPVEFAETALWYCSILAPSLPSWIIMEQSTGAGIQAGIPKKH